MFDYLMNDAEWVLNSVQSWKVTYVKREANEAAHRFNKVALIFMNKLIHMEKNLNYIIDLVCVERFALDSLSNE
jgi:hypothetical protein